jgi:arsenate reductase
MSEALFQRAAQGRHEARSAGTTPAARVHENVVTVMNEMNVDLSNRMPSMLTTELAQWADVVITMGCGDTCPVIPGKRYIDWDLPDPKDMSIEKVRALRDDVASRVIELMESLDRKSNLKSGDGD